MSFKITNGEAGAFNSPVIGKLFQSEDRQFPIADAFRLSDMIKCIQDRMGTYRDQAQKIIEKHTGIAAPNGMVTYKDPSKMPEAQKEIDILNKVEIEIPGEKVKMRPDWPKLSLAEATILRPLIKE